MFYYTIHGAIFSRASSKIWNYKNYLL